MSDSPPKDDAVPGPAQTPNAAEATKPETAKSETAAPAARGALDEAAKAMDAVVVKPDVPAPAAETKSDTAEAAKPDFAKEAEPAKPPGFTADPKPAVDLMQLSANTSGMHQQYVAPGVQRQSLLSSTKYQIFFIGALMLTTLFMMRGGGLSAGLGDSPGPQSTLTIPAGGPSGDPQQGFPDPNNPRTPPPMPQADFTVNAGVIGSPVAPTATKKGDGGADKGGYAEETADLEAARLMVAKDPNKALAMCDQHDIDYPRGMLGPEARVIRVEAYAKKGDDARALALGNDFLDDYPHSPRAQRVVAIVEALKNKLDAGQ